MVSRIYVELYNGTIAFCESFPSNDSFHLCHVRFKSVYLLIASLSALLLAVLRGYLLLLICIRIGLTTLLRWLMMV